MDEFKITVKSDYSEQKLKSDTLRNIPRAFKRNATQWASRTVLYIKNYIRGGNVFKQAPKEIIQRLGMKTDVHGQQAEIVLGTGGVVGKDPVVYARIQEEGGWIVPAKAKALTIPLPGVTGAVANYGTFGPGGTLFTIRSKAGNGLVCMKTGKSGFKPLFILSKSVKLPARYWFTNPIAQQIPDLERTMSPEGVWATAQQLAYERTAAQGGIEG